MRVISEVAESVVAPLGFAPERSKIRSLKSRLRTQRPFACQPLETRIYFFSYILYPPGGDLDLQIHATNLYGRDIIVTSDAEAHRIQQDESVVANLYVDALGRPADFSGLAYWSDQLDTQTTSVNSVASKLLDSTEYRTLQINRLYQTVLGRAAELAGVDYWLNYFAGGHSIEEMKVAFYGSDEYFAANGGTNETLVSAYYHAFLNRTPDSNGLANWTNALAAGASRSDVAQGIASASQEGAQRMVTDAYSRYLRRSPDAAGLTYWTTQIQSGASPRELDLGLLSSVEYFERPADGLPESPYAWATGLPQNPYAWTNG